MSVSDEVLRLVRSGPAEEQSRFVQVEVDNPMLAEALAATVGRAGWVAVPFRHEHGVLVSDRAPARLVGRRPGNRVVIVCDPVPLAARVAIDAVSELVVAAVVCSDQPNDLASALRGIEDGRVSIPVRVVELAARMPDLTERQLELIAGVAAGQSNSEIATGLGLSEASVKRDLRSAYAVLEAGSRSLMVARALELGVRPKAVRP